MRKALIVGINDYSTSPLKACIPDALRMTNILSRDYDNTPNFHCRTLISSDDQITKEVLSEAIIELYSGDSDVALLYFSGHGSPPTKTSQACLVTQDARNYSEGVPVDFILNQLTSSKAKQKILILDCCFSGSAGNFPFINEDFTFLPEGTSILTSSHQSQVSFEDANGGIFTTIVCSALEGGAADTLGLVNVANIYSFADKLLGPWDQRPIFKAHVSKMIPLRRCKPHVPIEILRKLPVYFPTPDYYFQLDPTYESDAEPKGHDNEKIFPTCRSIIALAYLYPKMRSICILPL